MNKKIKLINKSTAFLLKKLNQFSLMIMPFNFGTKITPKKKNVFYFWV